MKKILLVLTVLALSISYGCSHQMALNPNLDITYSPPEKITARVGLFIPPEDKYIVVSDTSDGINKYTFDVGKSTVSIIYKACTRLFSIVEILEVDPTIESPKDNTLDYIILAKIAEANLKLSLTADPSGNLFADAAASASSNILVTLTMLDKNMNQIIQLTAKGTGSGVNAVGSLSSGADKFSATVETAVRNLGNNIIQQFCESKEINEKLNKLK